MTLGVLASFAVDAGRAAGERSAALTAAGVPIVWDSGAWSVFTGAATVDVDQHTAWVLANDHGNPAVRFVALDVIGDADATLANYRRQRAAGANVEPTLHYGEPLDQVDRLLDAGPPPAWLNVGGIVQHLKDRSKRRNIAAFIAAVRRRLPDGTRVHALGCYHPEVIRLVQVDAADSTYWLTLPRFRTLSLFDRRRGDWQRFTVCTTTTTYDSNRRTTWRTAHRQGRWLRDEYGLEPADLTVDPDDDRLLAASVEAHDRLAVWARSVHDAPMTVYLAGAIGHRVAIDHLTTPPGATP